MSPEMKDIPDIRQKMDEETAETLAREGLKPGVVEVREDGYRTKDVPDTFEWWYFDSQFDDGSTAVAVFNARPMTKPKGPLNPSLLFIQKTPDGKSVRLTPGFAPNEFEASADKCEVRLGPNHVSGDLERYELHAEAEGYAADLTFLRKSPSWRPGSGISSIGGKGRYFGWVAPIPYGTVEGTLTWEGETRKVKGTGYHDHNWGNVTPGVTIDHWYWGRAHVGDFSMIFVEMVTRKIPGMGSLKMPVFYLAKGMEILTDDGLPLSLITQDFVEGPGGRKYPTKLDFHWHSEDGDVTLAIRNPKMIESIDMMESVPRWERPLIHLFANPYYYDFNADLELEVDLKGVKAKESGTALYELMMLK